MLLKRIPKLNAKRYNIFFIGIHDVKERIDIVNIRDLYIGSTLTLNSLKQSKLSKIFQNTINPVNKLTLPINYKLRDTNEFESTFTPFIKNNLNFWKFPTNLNMYAKITFLLSIKKLKILYTPGYGNYLLFLYANKFKKKIIFRLPSGFKLITDYWILAVLGVNKYKQVKKYSPQYMKYNLRKKNKSVRGVAMNPVDHHNGGRAKKKPLFLNKYNNIAKNNK